MKEVAKMSTQINPLTNNTAKPVVAGIFNILVGAGCLLGVLGIIIAALVVMPFSLDIPFNLGLLFVLVAIPLAALGVISVIGGIYDLRRKMWGWALAGSITTAIASNALGIAAIVLTALSKNEFAGR
jgi:hypothetical protein